MGSDIPAGTVRLYHEAVRGRVGVDPAETRFYTDPDPNRPQPRRSPLQGLRQSLLRNLGIKITSLVLAVAVYAHVYARQEQETVLRLPLVLEGLPAGLAYRGDVAEYLRVRVRAKGSDLIRLRAQPPRVVIPLAAARPGLLQRPVTTGDVVFPNKVDAAVIALVEPMVLSLQIEPIVTACLPVAVVLRGTPASASVRYGAARVWPETLTVSGPAGLISTLDSARTEELNINGRAESFGASLRLALPAGVHARTEQVAVRVPIVPLGRQTYGPFAVALPPGLRASWRLAPDSVSVRLGGPRTVLESVRASDLRVHGEPSGPLEEGMHVRLDAILPLSMRNQVRVESFEPGTVELRRRVP